eukprot:scaffold3851_cov387-Prasinococcus_capsulatus_cf.AAC.6
MSRRPHPTLAIISGPRPPRRSAGTGDAPKKHKAYHYSPMMRAPHETGGVGCEDASCAAWQGPRRVVAVGAGALAGSVIRSAPAERGSAHRCRCIRGSGARRRVRLSGRVAAYSGHEGARRDSAGQASRVGRQGLADL